MWAFPVDVALGSLSQESSGIASARSRPGAEAWHGLGLIVGTLNLFYGIAAVANSSFYVAEERYVFGGLHTWGWITIVLGVIQFTAAFSLFAGNMYGRVIGLIAATLGAIEALANVGGPHP